MKRKMADNETCANKSGHCGGNGGYERRSSMKKHMDDISPAKMVDNSTATGKPVLVKGK